MLYHNAKQVDCSNPLKEVMIEVVRTGGIKGFHKFPFYMVNMTINKFKEDVHVQSNKQYQRP